MKTRVGLLVRRALLVLVAVAMIVLGSSAVADAASFTVNDTTDAPLANPTGKSCVSTHKGKCTLRAAVQAADNNKGPNTIVLKAKTYKLTIAAKGPSTTPDPSSGDLDITAGDVLTITGAGSTKTTINANHIDRAFAVQKGAKLKLSGLTIENGIPSANSTGSQNGGGIYSDGALSLIGDVALRHNSPTYYGGAIYDDSDTTSSLSVVRSTFSDNTAGNYGGAIYDQSGNLGPTSITASTFSGNISSNDLGGALYLGQAGTATLARDRFSGNSALPPSGSGGAVITEVASVTISHSVFTSNTAGYGGAIDDEIDAGYTLTLRDNSFSGNSAQYGGGLDYRFEGALFASGNTFSDNSAPSGDGGAIYQGASGPTATLTNNTLDGNSASSGGGLYNAINAVTLKLVNNTIARNRASTGQGGGIADPGFVGPGSTYSNNIVADNTGGDCTSANPLSGAQDPGNNLDSDKSCFGQNAGDKTGVNPKLGPLANNGGPTKTDALLPGSPAINAANDATCPPRDQRGVKRPQGPRCDIGSFEVEKAKLSLHKSGPQQALKGSHFNYKIPVADRGPGPSTGTLVKDKLPANTTLLSASPSQGSCSRSGQTVSCHLGLLTNGSHATITLTVAVSKAATVTNTAKASNDEGSHAKGSATTTVVG